MASIDQIINQLREADHPELPEGHPVADGKPHRYGPRKKHWYSLHEIVKAGRVTGYTGAFGQWSGDDNGAQTFVWQGESLAPEDIEASRARQRAVEREVAQKLAQAQKLAANRARQQWQDASEEGPSVYLERKHVTPEGVRFDADGTVLVPMFQWEGDRLARLAGLQKITPDGAKRFNKGMEKKGAALLLGDIGPEDRVAMLGEGYATGRSIRMATDGKIPLVVCFDAGNILSTARTLRRANPALHLLICADDDWKIEQRLRDHLAEEYGYTGELLIDADPVRIECRKTWYRVQARYVRDETGTDCVELSIGNDVVPERRRRFGNTGLMRAREAAAAVGNASVVYPRFAGRGERKLTDFNDLHGEEGLHVVKAQIETALRAALAPVNDDLSQDVPASEGVPAFAHLHALEAVTDPVIDPMYDQAVSVVRESRRASAPVIQRQLQIGYNRAARLLEAMETAGVVSPAAASGARRVLGTPTAPTAKVAVGAAVAMSAAAETPDWTGIETENGHYTWEQRLRRTDKGALKPDLDNVIDILQNDKVWQGVLGFERFSQKIMKLDKPVYDGGETGEWTDHDDVLLTYWLGKTWSITPRRDIVVDAVSAIAKRNGYHVVLDYLESLSHDGGKRVDTWLIRYLGVEDTEYARLAGYKWLLGAVGRVVRPGCKMDNVLILEGPQDAGKSRALSTLFGQSWTTDANLNLSDSNTPIVMAGKWAIELAELDSLSKADAASAKRWITTQVDTFRPPYGRRAIDLPRQCVVAGTVNFDTYLKDESGNRRFWPVKVAPHIDLSSLRADRDQIWAEAFALYREWERANEEAGGELPTPWQVMKEQKHLFEIEQAARYEGDIFESIIAQFLLGRDRATAEEIMFDGIKLEVSKASKAEQRRVGAAMKAIGWQRRRESTGARRWYYVPPEPVVERPAASREAVLACGDDDDAPL